MALLPFLDAFAFVSSTSYERFEAPLLLVAATPRCVSVVAFASDHDKPSQLTHHEGEELAA
jgi:hypothetical protein